MADSEDVGPVISDEQYARILSRLSRRKMEFGPARDADDFPGETGEDKAPSTVSGEDVTEGLKFLARESVPFIGGMAAGILTRQPGVAAETQGTLRALMGVAGGMARRAGAVGLGGAGAETMAMGIERFTGTKIRSPEEMLLRAGMAFASEAGGEGLGLIVPRFKDAVVTGAKGISRKSITDQGKRAIEFLTDSPMMQKIRTDIFGLTPAEATDSVAFDVMQNVGQRMTISKGAFRRYSHKRQTEIIEPLIDDWARTVGKEMDADELAASIVDVAKENLDVAEKPARMIYNAIDDEIGDYFEEIATRGKTPPGLEDAAGRAINTGPASEEVLQRGLGVDFSEGHKRLSRRMKLSEREGNIAAAEFADQAVQEVVNLGKNPTWTQAQGARSRLLSAKAGLGAFPNAKVGQARINEAISLLDNAMEKSLRKFDEKTGNDLAGWWRTANKITKGANKQYRPRIIKQFIGMVNPQKAGDIEAVASRIFQPNKPGIIRTVRDALVDPKTGKAPKWDDVQQWFISDLLFRRATKDGQLSGKGLKAAMDSLGPKVMKEAFRDNPQVLKDLREFADFMELAQGKQVSGLGLLAIEGGRKGLMGFVQGGKEGAYKLIIRPLGVAKIMTDPRISKFLLGATKAPAGSAKGQRMIARLLAEMSRAGIAYTLEDPLSDLRQEGPGIADLLRQAEGPPEDIDTDKAANLLLRSAP